MSREIIYIPKKKAYLILYSIIDNSINFLFYKEVQSSSSPLYSTTYTEVNKFDTAPTFSVSRKITVLFNRLFTDEIIQKIVKKEPLTETDLSLPFHNYLQYKLWNVPAHQYWLNAIAQNSIIQYDSIPDEVIFFKEIPPIDINYLNSTLSKNNYFCLFEYLNEANYSSFNYVPEIQELFSSKVSFLDLISHVKNSIEYRKKNFDNLDTYIVLACKKAGKDQNGFFHFPSLLTGIYRRNNENWVYSLTSLDQFPDEKLLNRTKCIIIPGSELNVYNDIEFLRKTERFLNQLISEILFEKKYPQLKILGTCFGMQIIMSALGGKVIKSGIVQRFPVEINLQEKFWDLGFVKKSGIKKQQLKICQAHGDAVVAPAEENFGIELIGRSEKCEYEVLVDKTEKIFLIEGHPEYSPMFLAMKGVEWYLMFEKLEPTEENVVKFLEKSENDEKNKNNGFNEWRAICFTFMKS